MLQKNKCGGAFIVYVMMRNGRILASWKKKKRKEIEIEIEKKMKIGMKFLSLKWMKKGWYFCKVQKGWWSGFWLWWGLSWFLCSTSYELLCFSLSFSLLNHFTPQPHYNHKLKTFWFLLACVCIIIWSSGEIDVYQAYGKSTFIWRSREYLT